jgi:serine/threonine protein kinase
MTASKEGPPGALIWAPHKEKCTFKKILSRGGQATIYLMTRKNSELNYAVKVYKNRVEGTRECIILDTIKSHPHPHLVNIQHFEEDLPAPNLCSIFLDYCDGGDLWHFIDDSLCKKEAIPEMFIWKVFVQLADALSFLHQGRDIASPDASDVYTNPCPIVHRDIKPANIFLFSNDDADGFPSIKLGDFGLSAFITAGHAYTVGFSGGSPPYQPQEQIAKPNIAGPAQDIWAVGATIHEMALGAPPVDTLAGNCSLTKPCDLERLCPRAYQNISLPPDQRLSQWIDRAGSCTESWGKQYSPLLNFYMGKCMSMKSADRPSAFELCQKLEFIFTKTRSLAGEDSIRYETEVNKLALPVGAASSLGISRPIGLECTPRM